MKGAIKFIGTNTATRSLQDTVSMDAEFIKVPNKKGGEHFLIVDDKSYILTGHSCSFRSCHILVSGLITDGDAFMGRVSFLFFPTKSLTLEKMSSILLA